LLKSAARDVLVGYGENVLDTLAYFMGGPLPPRLYALPPGLELEVWRMAGGRVSRS